MYSALKGCRGVPEYHGLYIADAWSDQGESISMLGSIQKKVVVMVLEDVGEPKEGLLLRRREDQRCVSPPSCTSIFSWPVSTFSERKESTAPAADPVFTFMIH